MSAGGLAGVRSKSRRAVELATKPTAGALEECARLLGEAVAEAEQAGGVPALLEAVREGIRRDLAMLTALLQQAAEFHLGWSRLEATLVNGYTGGGVPAPLEPGPRLSMQG